MIYIVRHGQTDWNLKKICQGRKDIELNDTGIQQAQILRDKLKGINFDYVFSSPLKRSLQTAKIITDHDIIIDERLIERCNGQFEGKLTSECPYYDFNDPNDTRFDIENIIEFKSRIVNFLEELQTKYSDCNVLIATHAGVILYIREFFEGKPKDGDYEGHYKLKNGEVLVYDNKK